METNQHMTRPTLVLALCMYCSYAYAQKADTLIFFYQTDAFQLTKPDRQKLDQFLSAGWDKISINGYTDEADDEDHNLELSRKRSKEVYDYLLSKNLNTAVLSYKYFGETMPRADNGSDEGRALNRRTEIIGYRYARIPPRPVVNPMLPVTKSLDNGFIITYRPGGIPASLAANLEAGSAINFQLITNTTQMQENNVYTNTTRGEILSSVLVICNNQINPCQLDSPVLLKIPIPFDIKCSVDKIRFYYTVVEKGKKIWQENGNKIYPEVIGNKKYIGVWIDNFCECINFDFKVDPDCFDTDSIQMQFVNAKVRNLTVELAGLNSIYLPKKLNDSTYSVLFLKDKLQYAPVNFTLYSGKRRIRSFRNQQLSSFDYDTVGKKFLLSTARIRLYFPKLEIADVALRVNKDKYRVTPEKNRYEFIYLDRKDATLLVDFSIVDKKGNVTQFKNQPLHSLPFDEQKGCWVVDRNFVKALKEKQSITARL